MQTNATATGLAAGTYDVTVEDASGCLATATATINDLPGGTASANVVSNTSGFSMCDGEASSSMTGGTAPYTYVWNDPNAQTTVNATGLCAGSYCVTITDANGCLDSACITITEPNAITLILLPTDILCFGDCTGEIELTVSGGIGPYTYLWMPGGMTAEDITNLCAGIYSVTVTDNNGVISVGSASVNEPDSALSTVVAGTDILCNGDATGSIDLSVSGGTSPYTYAWTPGGETTEDISGLAVGTYSVLVTDSNGCTTTASYTIVEPPLLSVNASGNDANCGQADGDVSAFPSGGTGGYTYLWSDLNNQTTATATGLTAGGYTVTITDANGCTATATVNISDLGGGAAVITVDNNATCLGNCDGQATASITGGTAPFSYIWSTSPAQNTATATGLCAGNYNVTITDNVGCISTETVNITEPASLTIIINQNDAICNGSCDGDATALPAGGTAPYSYSWNTIPPQTGITATGLCAGNYEVTLTDKNNCTTIGQVTINEPLEITLSLSTTTSHCGQADGTASVIPSNGNSPYTFIWDDSNTQTNATATGLLAGTYAVTVTDSAGCTNKGLTSVSDTTGPTSIISNTLDVTCSGGGGGEITVNVADGTPPYTFLWNDGNAQTSATATGLNAGSYSVSVTDAFGCITTATGSINEPAPLLVSIASTTNTNCFSSCDGIASANANGGTAPYTYIWSDGQITPAGSNLCAGTYGITVTDANGCQDSTTATITEPVLLTVSGSTTDASCANICDATGTATPSGGTMPYTYSWNTMPVQTSATATGLCDSTYLFQVTDNNGCVYSSNVITGEPLPITSSMINEVGVDCFGDCDGYAEVGPSGGNAPYSFLWSDGQTAALAIGLCAGSYSVTITDNNGCNTIDIATIIEPAILDNTFIVVDVDCNGNATGSLTATITGGTSPYTYQWDDVNLQTTTTATGLIAGVYTVSITDGNGCTLTENATVNEPVAIVVVIDTSGSNCGQADGSACITISSGTAPFSYNWSTSPVQITACATGLLSGAYNVTITDSTGCNIIETAIINDLGAPTLSISSFGDASCNGSCDGFATVQITYGEPPFTYSWNDPGNQTTALASGLCAGTYTVNILDSNGCSGSIDATIGEPFVLSLTISSTNDVTCNADCDGDATALASGGTGVYTYNWNTIPVQTGQTATGLCAGNYGLTVIDENGCIDTTTATINEPLPISLTTTVIDAHCGLADGSASVIATGGNGLYGYSWDDGQNTSTATNLLAGPYTVVVTDFEGCTNSIIVTVNDLPPGVPTIVNLIDVSCNSSFDGQATVSMAGGTAPLSYLWSNGQTSSAATGFGAGAISVDVTDSNGCVVTANATINEPSPLSLSIVPDSANCNGSNDGSATAIPAGGTGTYTYSWDDPLVQTNATATGLAAGSYSVTIYDANGCSNTSTTSIEEPMAISLSETHNDANCGQSNGIATITVSGGTSPYSYLWDNGATTAFVTGVSAGTYTVTVTDKNNCEEILPVIIADLTGPTVSIINTGDISCFGGNDGFATVSASGGTIPYTYLWNDNFNQSAPTAASLAAGQYSVTVTDSTGCAASIPVTIYEPDSIMFNPSSTSPTCFGDCDGSAGVNVIGGTTPYSYSWNSVPGQSTATATGLCDGIYSVIISDSNGCNAIGMFAIINPLPITATTSSSDVTCFNTCDGDANAIVSNGTSPYSYIWDGGQVVSNPTNLCAGNYGVTITDANGCTALSSATIGTPTEVIVSASSSDVSCNGYCDGFAQVTPSGGTPGYTYLWSDNQITAGAVALCAGSYDVTVTDLNGCNASTSVVINQPQGMSLTNTQTNVSCFNSCDGTATVSVSGGTSPYSMQWDDGLLQTTYTANNLCNGIYNVTVTDLQGCMETSSVIITQPQQLDFVASTSSSTCGLNNGSASISVIGGLSPVICIWPGVGTQGLSINNVYAGVYNPVLTDANGCIFTAPVIIDDIAGPIIDSVVVTDVICTNDSNGTATVYASGVAPPFTYFWENASGDTIGINSTSILGVSGGNYTVTVVDNNGCKSSGIASINEPSLLVCAIVSSSGTSCYGVCDGSATVYSGGGTAPYTYLWTDGQTTSIANGLCAGTHNAFVTDNNGCTSFSTVSITEPLPLAIIDSVNDVSCNGNSDGSIYINITGGTGPVFIYNWLPAGTGNGPIVTNLSAQAYNLTVQDMNGCIENIMAIVNEPPPLTYTVNTTASTCGLANGIGEIIASGGVSPYTYQWPTNDTTSIVNTLVSGLTYNVNFSDANGCTQVIPISVSGNPGPAISLTANGVICFGDLTGTATVTIDSNGTSPFYYLWDDSLSQSNAIATGLAGDEFYNVTVTDDNGCVASAPVYVSENPELMLLESGDITICYGDSTEISVTGVGGFAINDYYYHWSHGLSNAQTHFVSPDTTTTYTVYIEDDYGCRSSADGEITVTVLPPISVVPQHVIICVGEIATVEVLVSGGNGGPYTVIWDNGFIGSQQSISGLLNDTSYSVSVSDGCSLDSATVVNVEVRPVPEVDFIVEGSGCEPAVFTAYTSAAGVVPIVDWFWDFGDGGVSNDPDSTVHIYTTAGVYDVTLIVTSDEGCVDTIIKPGVVNAYALPTAGFDMMQNGNVLDPNVTSILTPSIDFVNTSTSNVDSLIWDFGDVGSGTDNFSNEENPTHQYSDTGTFIVTLTVYTAEGCMDIITQEVVIEGEYILFAPNAFTPNDDGDNEYFLPKGIGVKGEDFEMLIFDRWGDLIAEVSGVFSDDISIGWDGRANDGPDIAQIDVYVWLINTKDEKGVKHQYIGHITLLQ